MIFLKGCRQAGIDPDKDIAFFCVGTDGLNRTENNLMSVSMARNKNINTWYVDGACPELAEKYTDVSVEHYNKHKCEEEYVEAALEYQLKDVKMLITFRSGFTLPWIGTKFPFVLDYPILDILRLIPFQNAQYDIPSEIQSPAELVEYIHGESITLPHAFFGKCVSRMTEATYELPLLEQRIYQLYELFNICLRK